MITEKVITKNPFVDKFNHVYNAGDEVMILPEASTPDKYCYVIDVGITDFVDRKIIDGENRAKFYAKYIRERKRVLRQETLYDSYYDNSTYGIDFDTFFNELNKWKETLSARGAINSAFIGCDTGAYGEIMILLYWHEYETEQQYIDRIKREEDARVREIEKMKVQIDKYFEEAKQYINKK